MNLFKARNQKGFSAIQAIIATAVVVGAASGVSSLFLGRLKGEQEITVTQSAAMIQRNVLAAVSHDVGWRFTIFTERNGNQFECLRTDGALCAVHSPSKFGVFLANGQELAPLAANAGFDVRGNRCNEFDGTNGNDDCPFRYEVTWKCAGSACAPTEFISGAVLPSRPRIALEGKLLFRPSKNSANSPYKKVVFKEDEYSFSITRGEDGRDISSLCRSIGGYFDQGANHCTFQSSDKTCDPELEYIAGYKKNGEPICKKKRIIGFFCPPGKAVTGLDETGALKCLKF